jgi:hypothetical protein
MFVYITALKKLEQQGLAPVIVCTVRAIVLEYMELLNIRC